MRALRKGAILVLLLIFYSIFLSEFQNFLTWRRDGLERVERRAIASSTEAVASLNSAIWNSQASCSYSLQRVFSSRVSLFYSEYSTKVSILLMSQSLLGMRRFQITSSDLLTSIQASQIYQVSYVTSELWSFVLLQKLKSNNSMPSSKSWINSSMASTNSWTAPPAIECNSTKWSNALP